MPESPPATARAQDPVDPAGDAPAPARPVVGDLDYAAASDAALGRAAGMGDRAAFEQIVTRHGPSMYRYAVRLTGDDGDAQEAVQDAFVAAWKGIDGFAGRSSLRTWLFSLTGHKAIDTARKRRPVPVPDDALTDRPSGGSDDPEQVSTRSALLGALDVELAQLPTRQRACWLLIHVEGLSQAEAAEALSMTPDAVRGQLARARKTLSERMSSWR